MTRGAPAGVLGEAVAELTVRPGFEQPTLVVAPGQWRLAVRTCRDHPGLDLAMLDMLAGVDCLETLAVVAHLFSPRLGHHALLETRVPATSPQLDSVADLYPSAAWHERETYEMFGVVFAGHPDLRPLLLADTALDAARRRPPLRKEVDLADRARPWPGAVEPGGVPARRPQRPFGAPG